jgi:hypothetical protein
MNVCTSTVPYLVTDNKAPNSWLKMHISLEYTAGVTSSLSWILLETSQMTWMVHMKFGMKVTPLILFPEKHDSNYNYLLERCLYEGRLKSSRIHLITPFTFSRSEWSVVRSALLAKGGTSKKRLSLHLHKVLTQSNNKVSPRTFQTALVAPSWKGLF